MLEISDGYDITLTELLLTMALKKPGLESLDDFGSKMDQKNKLTKLHISVPIWLKDLLVESAEKEGMVLAVLRPQVRVLR